MRPVRKALQGERGGWEQREPASGVRPVTRDSKAIPKLWDDEDTEVSMSTALVAAAIRNQARPRLTVLTGLSAGRVHSLDGKREWLLGRSHDADIRFDDTGVSRNHCRLVQQEDGRFYLEDLKSSNGTLVNGDSVRRVPLFPGDRIQLGPSAVVQLGASDDAEAALACKLYEASTQDALTKVFNRRYFSQRLDVEVSHARRHRSPLCVLMIDLDFFKSVNDTFGHAAGDALLGAVSDAIRRCARTEDLVSRYGGEEFALLVRETSLEAARTLAERIRLCIAALRVPFGSTVLQATASIGVAELSECTTAASDALVQLADARLYHAKEAGRNRTCSQ